MHRFWHSVIEPLLNAAEAASVIEIGVERGGTTRLLLERAERVDGGVVHAIDPGPKLDAGKWQARFGPRLRLHRERSLDVLGGVGPVDAVLVDGDHNWYTVINELELVATTAARADEPLPLVLAHDVGWPYGRRDMYFDIDSIPEGGRQEAAREYGTPSSAKLNVDGVTPWVWGAVHGGGPRNGVLTAVEDFAAAQDPPCELFVIEGFHGLAVLVSPARLRACPGLRGGVRRLKSSRFAQEWLRIVERARVEAETQTEWETHGPGARPR